MAEHKGEDADLIHESLLNMGSRELDNLAQILASECRMQLWRLQAMLESSREAERIMKYVESLSTEQKKMLVGRVTLRLLRKITAFMENMEADGLTNSSSSENMEADGLTNSSSSENMEADGLTNSSSSENMEADGLTNSSSSDWDKEPLSSRQLHSIDNARENIPRSLYVKRHENKETSSELGYGVWADTDAALILLILHEAQDQECLEAAKKYGVNPLLYKNFVVGKMPTNHNLLPVREYLRENILKMGFCVPGLMASPHTQPASVSSYVDIINRYQRFLRLLSNSGNNNNNYLLKEDPYPASVASVLCLPSVVYDIGAKYEESQRTCSVCGDDFEAGTVVSFLPCSHVYHWDCIHPWLKARNTCAVCRYEFPTDDVSYELRRHMRLLMKSILC